MTIIPYTNRTSFITTYLVNTENLSILIGLSCINQDMLDKLKDKVYLICTGDTRNTEKKPVLEKIRNLDIIDPHSYPHSLEDGPFKMLIYQHPTSRGLYCVAGSFVFSFDLAMGPLINKLDDDMVILSSDSPITTVRNERKLEPMRKALLNHF